MWLDTPGVEVRVASEWFGHKRLSVFLDIYQGIMPRSHASAEGKLDAAWGHPEGDGSHRLPGRAPRSGLLQLSEPSVIPVTTNANIPIAQADGREPRLTTCTSSRVGSNTIGSVAAVAARALAIAARRSFDGGHRRYVVGQPY